jgi:putative membrane-bound dehydrogenase-like protein
MNSSAQRMTDDGAGHVAYFRPSCWVLAFIAAFALPVRTQADDFGLRVAPGFRITLFADHELANDIYAMTLDAQGRVVVTGPGYVKILHDTKNTGKADRATLFATPAQGGMGMCFDGNDLYYCGEGWFSRYRDSGGKGRADGPPEHLWPLAYAEHGGHAMRKGPDGWWYLMGGNDSGINRRHVTLPHSPIRDPEGGALLRLTPDCRQSEVIAHGFRNPYDFDFNAAGDLFTYDSDCEREFFLPWYTPTRIYHVGYAGHHGWRLGGWLRSWCRRDFYVDTVDMLWPVGRGSPTGVTCYRHHQFPAHYRGGFFALDWTFGRIYFFPLEPQGATYRTTPEVFVEAVGTSGFDPTDIAVAPDGSLFVSMGGRGTRGAVYHIEYVGEGLTSRSAAPAPRSELESVLQAPQPLDAWSRAVWMPVAKKLGAAPFVSAACEETRMPFERVRAIEVLTELFGGLPSDVARTVAAAAPAPVRARVAWALGRLPCEGWEAILPQLAVDASAHVRAQALHALADRAHELPDESLGGVRKVLLADFGHTDKRVRQAAARLASLLPDDAARILQASALRSDLPQVRLTAILADLLQMSRSRSPESALKEALAVLGQAGESQFRLQAIRLIMIALGDYRLHDASAEIYTGYSLARASQADPILVKQIRDAVRPLFPSADKHLNEESTRLLAMLEDEDTSLLQKIASMWSVESSPTEDVHYLVVFSRLRGPRDEPLTRQVAAALLGLHQKLQGREQRVKQVWEERLGELLDNLLRRDPSLAAVLLKDRAFVDPGNVFLAASLDLEHRKQAARLFLAAVRQDADFAWSGFLVDLLSLLPAAQVHPVLRGQWSNFGLREAILLRLAEKPDAVDRDKFLAGLESNQQQVLNACLTALDQLPRDDTPRNLLPLLRLLRRLEQEPKERALRRHVLALLVRQSAKPFAIDEGATDSTSLKRTYAPVYTWFTKQHPDLASALHEDGDDDPAVWNKLLAAVDWSKGDAVRGEAIFRQRACQTCHTGSRALGPDLTGVATRFSRDDLMTAIIYPSRDVAPAYRMSVIETRNGQLVTGIVAFESADGLIVQTGAATTVRIANDDIVSRLPSNRSLMPNGLLKDLKPEDVADLYRYLQTLKPALKDKPKK